MNVETQPILREEQSGAQRLSNRTILRFQELADELQRSLKHLPPLGIKIEAKDVLLVSADRSNYRFGGLPDSHLSHSPKPYPRNYNLRLTRRSTLDPALVVIMKRHDNLERFKSLFNIAARVAGTSNHFEDFKRSVEAFEASEQAQITAYNLLIDACAVFPYAGLLPGALDSVQNPSDVAQLRWFRLIATNTQACAADAQVPSVYRLAEPLQGKFTYELYKTLPDFTAHSGATQVKLSVNIHGGTGTPEELHGLQTLYLEFIDHFLLNRPLLNDGKWPPFKDARLADKEPG